MNEERREHERHGKYLGVRFQNADGKETLSMTRDISAGGMAFLSGEALPAEQKLSVEILRGDDTPAMPAEFQVLRHDSGQDAKVVAGKFTAIEEKDRRDLGEFLVKFEN